eukprot:TRINITY_DN34_c0_g1_i3.p1 TRINITY_DN34_c0_g1~~TRINITY_DN34_c0_g1_i3.p1  ORF type:complete len:1014 (-),score=158.98 TRINITY_DN34_c0_g1_i3:754-3795(-)
MSYRRAALALAALAVAFVAASPLLERQECAPAGVADIVEDPISGDRRPRLKQYELAFTDYPAYGVPSADGHPNYVERATHAWHNLIRTAHVQFVNDYMVGSMKSGDTTYSKVFATPYYTPKAPVPWDYNLNRLARAHSTDRTTTCPGATTPSPHSDCNASTTCPTCSMSQRFQRWYTPITTYGEIYFEWYRSTAINDIQWPFLAAGGWICEGPLYSSCVFSGCVVDEASGHSYDGHRYSMMNLDGRVGHGYAEVANNQFVSTANMVAGSDVSPFSAVHLVSGAHTLVPPVAAATEYFFIASYRGTTVPSSAAVVIDGASVAMSLSYGSSSVGGFTYKTAGYPISGASACKAYYFLINGERYPTSGHFLTSGVGSCTTDWADDSGGSCQCTSGTCCDGCNYRASSYVCRAAADSCDVAESCTGASASCPADNKVANGTTCSGVTCTNGNDKCINGVCTCVPTTPTCQCTSGTCCDGCNYRASSYVCHAATDVCDVAEYCTGSSTTCPTDTFRASTYVCRVAADACDVAEYCTGSSGACPTDKKATNGTTCSGVTCSNGSDKCINGVCTCIPTPQTCACTSGECCDGCNFRASTYSCRTAADGCDVAEYCTGTSTVCPTDKKAANGTTCSGVTCSNGVDKCINGVCLCVPTCQCTTGVCCDGCNYRTSSYVCRAASTCDLAEYCTGTSGECPADQKAANGTSCSGVTCANGSDKCINGVCTCVQSCSCTSGACCDGCNFRPSTYACRAAASTCDVAEYCTGSSTVCPADQKAANGTSCSGITCANGSDKCVNGVCTCVQNCACTSGTCCDGCNFRPSTYTCRSAASTCDVAEYCSGSSSACPADQKAANGTSCSGVTCSNGSDKCINGACTCVQSCSCTSGACCDGCNFRASTFKCRAAAGSCDLAEYCTGTSSVCPLDKMAVNGSTCSGSTCTNGINKCENGVCTCVQTCACSSGTCCDGCNFRPSSYLCRAAADDCDGAEYCSGLASECPADARAANGTTCNSASWWVMCCCS